MNNEFQENMDQLLNAISNKPGNDMILLSLLVSAIFACVMWLAYRISHDNKSYRREFGTTLIMLALISTVLMDLIQSNLALSLGMLGSLSIVRFRTNIKDYRDIGFIFWAMAIGIASATQSYAIAMIGSCILFAMMVFTRSKANAIKDMLLVIRGSNVDLDEVGNVVSHLCEKYNVKAKNVLADSFELVYEVEIHENKTNKIIDHIFLLGGIDSVNVLAQNQS